MRAAFMQAYFFPYVGYFQLISAVDRFVLYEHVSFRKRTWITRNQLLDPQTRQTRWIHVPVSDASSNRTIGETRLAPKGEWRRDVLRAVEACYRRAERFDEVYPFLETLVNAPDETIHAYNAGILVGLAKALAIPTPIVTANPGAVKLEEGIAARAEASGLDRMTQRVVDLCRAEGADEYVNPIGGRELYRKEDLARHDVRVSFLQSIPTPYPQRGGEFVPYLSIIDPLMHLGFDGTRTLLNDYKLV